MELLKHIYGEIEQYLDVPYIVVFMSITYLLKDFLHDTLIYITKKDLRDSKPSKHLIVFFIGTIVAIPFWFFFGHDKMILFVSYCVGTSLHSVVLNTLNMLYKKFLKFLKLQD